MTKPRIPAASPARISLSVTRRSLLKQLSLTPLMLRPAAFSAWASSPASQSAAFAETRYLPHYPVRSPLEDVLRLVSPGLDEFPSEQQAAELEARLARWAEHLRHSGLTPAHPFAPTLTASPLATAQQTLRRSRHGIESNQRTFASPRPVSAAAYAAEILQWIGPSAQVLDLEFQIVALELLPSGTVDTQVRYSLTTRGPGQTQGQRVGSWKLQWQPPQAQADWQIIHLTAGPEQHTVLHGPGFVDVTRQALGAEPSYAQQLLHGSDHWRTVLDGACGIDVYGNNGVAVGDFNNDGLDDLYVSQPAGLPNRLFRNRGDGTLEDVTEKAGVGVLDNTACALFADFRNVGLQDLLVVCGSGPLLFVNQGNGTFLRKPDAFQFAQPPQGTFTHAAVADYDNDGRLDIFFCLYSYYLGLDQYHYPAPYFDARNGPPNFLMHNQGDGTFVDRTRAAGLSVENDRYSFACAWGYATENAAPDLYVVNDFGRNNLFRNQGDGTFRPISEQAHVQDVGAGMSAAWADYNHDGRSDLYVANMWSAAGQRVSHLAAFHPASTPAVRELYQRHARGNALYRNEGGIFTNVSQQANVEMGRWAWGSDFFDFDRDGHPDLYITNGYITAPAAPSTSSAGNTQDRTTDGMQDRSRDLGSFFWRQVVGRSPDDATPSAAYEHGWNALNELIRTDSSWSGHERNVLLLNHGDGTFAEISGPLGLDFLEDGRCFALADLDGDGRLEVILKNRNAPQLRILHNAMANLGDAIAFRLQGNGIKGGSNRDAIGATVTVRCGTLTQTRSLQAGSGFLSQHSKELFFGLGAEPGPVSADVRWPAGTTQHFADLPRNSRVQLVEGDPAAKSTPFAPTAKAYQPAAPESAPEPTPPIPTTFGTWLLDPLKAPAFTLSTPQGRSISLESQTGRPVLLHLWSSVAPSWQSQLHTLDAVPAARCTVLALNLDDSARQPTLSLPDLRLSVLFATPELAGIYNLIFRYLFDRRANLPLPTSLLLDSAGMIVKVYQGPLLAPDLLADLRQIPASSAARVRLALPFPGTLYQSTFQRNDFTYGVAMFQHGYLDQAAASFEQVIAARPDNAEAYYNLGTLNLRRNDFPTARENLRRTLTLKPDYPEAWNNLGMMDAQQGRTRQAVESFQKSLALRPSYATALLNLGNLYRHERNFPEAESALTRALALAPEDPEASYSLGMLFAQQEQFPAAEQYLKQAIALRPAYPEALNNLGVLYVRQQNDAQAEQQFLTCLRLSPTYEPTYLNLARLYLSQGDRAKARKSIADLLRLNPESQPGKQARQALGPE